MDSTVISENSVMKEKGGPYIRGRWKKERKIGKGNEEQLKTFIQLFCSEYDFLSQISQ